MKQLEKKFITVFGAPAEKKYFSPGRINLIGEHTDYNGGNVFPAAITIGTYGLIRKRDDQTLRFYSENFPDLGVIEIALSQLSYNKDDQWTNYPKGICYFLEEAGHSLSHGLDIFFYGTIPNGAGLSSSASIELLMGLIVSDCYELNLSMIDLVHLGKRVENEYIGVNSGIMDQFAIGMGKKDHAILLNTNTMDYELVPAEFDEYLIVIMNTNKRRELADSKYNERRSECESALAYLQKEEPDMEHLCDINLSRYDEISMAIPDNTLRQRAKHAISENERTLLGKKALTNGDLIKFGQLLNASHASLKEDYEVTGHELDTLVHAAQQQPGVLGARMTGAGFGGCAIALVKEDMLELFKENVGQAYLTEIGYAADFYEAKIDDGTRILR